MSCTVSETSNPLKRPFISLSVPSKRLQESPSESRSACFTMVVHSSSNVFASLGLAPICSNRQACSPRSDVSDRETRDSPVLDLVWPVWSAMSIGVEGYRFGEGTARICLEPVPAGENGFFRKDKK